MTAVSQAETIDSPLRVSRPPSDARTLLVSSNRRAGTGGRHKCVREICGTLERLGYKIHIANELDSLHGLAVEVSASGQLRAVLAIGGDGTASIVRNHVPLEVPLLPVPMGTENLLGRYLLQSATPDAVSKTVEDGVVVSLDLGRAGDKVFLLMISAGFDAEVIRSLHENRRGNIRHTAYVLPILRTIRSYTFPQMRLYSQSDDAAARTPQVARWLFGFNLPLYAFGLPVAPDAIGTDGLLDICTFDRGSVWSAGRYLWYVALKSHQTLPDAHLCRTHRFRIEPTTGDNIAYQIDGDYGGTLPVDVEVMPGQLRLLVPREAAQKLGFAVSA